MSLRRKTKSKNIAILIAIAACLSLLYWPTFRWLAMSWWSSLYYSHGFLVPVVSVFFIWTKRRVLQWREVYPAGIALVVGAIILYTIGFILDDRFILSVSFVFVLNGLCLWLLGRRVTRAMIFPLWFLLFMIPLPFIQDVGFFLQKVSLNASAWILDVAGLPITILGTEIHLEDTVFSVGLACSGINSLIALLALAAIYTHLLDCTMYEKISLFIIAMPLALLANIFRIDSIILVARQYGVGTAMGTFHDIASPLFFFLAFAALVLIGWIMKCRLRQHLMGN